VVGGVVQAQAEDAIVILAEVARAVEFGDDGRFEDIRSVELLEN